VEDDVLLVAEGAFLLVSADQAGDLLAGVVHRGLGLPAEAVVARAGVAVDLGEVGQHGLHDPGVAGGGGGVVEVDGGLDGHRGIVGRGEF
jgi:hypothetical protein